MENTTKTLKTQMLNVINNAMTEISDIQFYSTPLRTLLSDMDEEIFDEYRCGESPVKHGEADINRCVLTYLTLQHYRPYSWVVVNYARIVAQKLEACHEALSKVFDQLQEDIDNGQLDHKREQAE